MSKFIANHLNIKNAALKNINERMPLYEHGIAENIMEEILGKNFSHFRFGNSKERREYTRIFNGFWEKMGYDTVSFERGHCGTGPGGGSLGDHKPPTIRDRQDFEKYPWDKIPDLYIEKYGWEFEMLIEEMPIGMKAIGGVGNGVFEGVQDLVGFTELCYIKLDDPELYADIFDKMGEIIYKIWKKVLSKYNDAFTVYRFGDDLGFKTSTLISPEDIKEYILPWYSKIVYLIHTYKKPFLLHSCGQIFDVMEDIITDVKIDAKHSNEDAIAPFSKWVDIYGERIGNFGGIDTDVLCGKLKTFELIEYIEKIVKPLKGKRGIAISSGNSIPTYTNTDLYVTYIETVRRLRGE